MPARPWASGDVAIPDDAGGKQLAELLRRRGLVLKRLQERLAA